MKSYIDYFESGGEIEGKQYKRFFSQPFSFGVDTFQIPNPSIIGGGYQTIRTIYQKLKSKKNESKETNAKTIKESPSLDWLLHNGFTRQLPNGDYAVYFNNPNRNITTSSNIQ